jgi:hypothetical protein
MCPVIAFFSSSLLVVCEGRVRRVSSAYNLKVPVRSRRRAGTTVPGALKIRHALFNLIGGRVVRRQALAKGLHIRRDIPRNPMNPRAARRIRIIGNEGQISRIGRHIRPA